MLAPREERRVARQLEVYRCAELYNHPCGPEFTAALGEV